MKRKYLFMTLVVIILGIGNNSIAQPKVPLELLEARRTEFMNSIGDAVAIFPGEVRTRSGQADEALVNYFYYLTGFEDPNAWLILNPDGKERSVIFVRPFNQGQVIWSGEMPGIEGTKKYWGIDEVYSQADFRKFTSELLDRSKEVYTISTNGWLREELQAMIPESSEVTLLNAQPIIDRMRGIKDRHEIEMLKKAIDITAEAHQRVLGIMKPGMWEYEIEAEIEYVFRKNGATKPSFESIVGSGPRSTILHYKSNDHQIMDGDLVVMDIGAEFEHYKADVTRTIPANGKFTPEQLEIYNLVLKAQEEAISVMKPGQKISYFNEVVTKILMEGMYKLGLVTDIDSPWQKQITVLYFSGHFIGLDTHDVYSFMSRNSGSMEFEPGMIITIEPGIYLHPDILSTLHDRLGNSVPTEEIDNFIKTIGPVFEKYKNIGIRIEDDILITKDGNEILSKSAPKTPSEIESKMAEKR